jgi:hypothetical protein
MGKDVKYFTIYLAKKGDKKIFRPFTAALLEVLVN